MKEVGTIMIDLHTHTIFSDGTWTLEEMLTNAENSNISILSITDHDTALPHIKLKDIDMKKFFSGRVIVGGEFNAVFRNARIELLGYNFNPVQLQKWIDSTYTKKDEIKGYKEEFLEILELCKKNGIKISNGLKYDESLKYPTKIIHNDITKYKENKRFFTDDEWNVREAFFRSCTCNPKFILYRSFSKQYPSAKEVATQIRKARWKSIYSTFIFILVR